jgi:hypothetical protein
MTFVRIFSAEKDGWAKEIPRETKVKKNSVNFNLAPFIFPLTFTLWSSKIYSTGKYALSFEL